MKIRNCRRLLAGLVLVVVLGACSYSIKLPFIPDPGPAPAPVPECGEECDPDATGGRSTLLKLLLGP
jgi:hypothetical protein